VLTLILQAHKKSKLRQFTARQLRLSKALCRVAVRDTSRFPCRQRFELRDRHSRRSHPTSAKRRRLPEIKRLAILDRWAKQKLTSSALPGHWRPALGPSEEQKEIESLKQQIKLYEHNRPKPSILFLDERGDEITNISIPVRRCSNLLSDEVKGLINELKAQDPLPTPEELKSSPPNPRPYFTQVWRPPSDQMIAKFLEEEYPAWLAEIERILLALGTNLGIKSSIGRFNIALTNVGACPALRTKLELKTSGHFSLLRDEVQPASLFTLPRIPQRPFPPHGSFVNPLLESFEQAFPSIGQWTDFTSLHFDKRLMPILNRQERDKKAWYLEEDQGESSFTDEPWICSNVGIACLAAV
jgi:hypothetical protein